MSRQIQIRRGTAAEHNNFTGKIGEITMDTTNNTLRVHDGQTPGGTILAKQSEIPQQQTLPDNYDFVVESQMPTAENNYTWYRKYKSGWVEQGGRFLLSTGNYDIITLSLEMANTNYNVQIVYHDPNNADQNSRGANVGVLDTKYFSAKIGAYSGSPRYIMWVVSGLIG